ncbi:MAG TPA: hypothetical protein PKA82_09600 [Pyrinomonadaceae bacterium]|nr:hypothetical protein [Pyrinomonadaceae bacterium]
MATRRKTTTTRGTEILNDRWKLYLVMAIISVVIVAGFFLSGKQHFSSWDFSIRNNKLRKQIDDLETEKRRLILARETANSPNELKRAVSRLMPTASAPTAVPASAVKPIEKTADKNVELAVSKKDDGKTASYSIVKTAMVMPTKSVAKSEKPARTIAKNLAE